MYGLIENCERFVNRLKRIRNHERDPEKQRALLSTSGDHPLITRNPHRTFEDIPVAHQALVQPSGNFLSDLLFVASWCIDNCKDTIDRRKTFGMSPEPYGLPNKTGPSDKTDLLAHAQSVVANAIDKWQWIYDNLADWDSRVMLLTVVLYRSLGWRHVRMPLDNATFWGCMHALVEQEQRAEEQLVIPGTHQTRMDLTSVGFDMRLFSESFGVFNEFVYPQYSYRGRHKIIQPQNGDHAIDCGACFGGTSLFFANCVGLSGKVLSFEFFPANVEVFNRNLTENTDHARRITLIQAPVWENCDLEMIIHGSGPATQVLPPGNHGLDGPRIRSTTIDSAVEAQKFPSVDFIKMDIEGAELYALRGAEKTLKKFKPTLAICVYHKLFDFYEIPEWLHNLGLGYRFFLQHSSVHGDETVLFAEARI